MTTSRSLARVGAVALCLVLLGSIRIAEAQSDLSGSWASRNHEDTGQRGGPHLVDYTGLPYNDEARAKGLSYSPSVYAMIERQCALYPPHYLVIGPFGLKIWNETDSVSGDTIALKIGAWEDRFATTIWMDGRPHPSENMPHYRGGFTTGEWNGHILTTATTHIKAGQLRRNSAPNSDRETMTTHYIRHGDLLTVVAMIEDPIYLTETLTYTKDFVLNTAATARPIGPPCVAADEGGPLDGSVPHYLPGTNPSIDDVTEVYNIPREAVLGGAATMYPEFRKTMKDRYVRPPKCVRLCGGPPAAPAPTPAAPRP